MRLKKALAIILSVTTVTALTITPVSAAESDFESTAGVLSENLEDNIEILGDTSVLVESQGSSELVTVAEDDNTRTVTIKNLETGKENYLKYDKLSNTIYSSITGKTVDISNHGNKGGITLKSESSYSTEYISYAEIRDTIGTTATVAGVVGLILTKVPGAQIAGGITGTISTIVGGGTLLIPNDSSHGLKLSIKTVKYYRTRMGRRQVYKISHQITSVRTY